MDDGRAVNNGVYCQKGDYIRCQQEGVKGEGREGESRRTGPKRKGARAAGFAGRYKTNEYNRIVYKTPLYCQDVALTIACVTTRTFSKGHASSQLAVHWKKKKKGHA